jgi:spore germination protein
MSRETWVEIHGCSVIVNQWITLDSISIRPISSAPVSFSPALGRAGRCGENPSRAAGDSVSPRRVAVVTSFQGARYHPEVVRALGESPEALTVGAGMITRLLTAEGARGVILDFQGMTAEDLQTLMDVSRTIGDSIRSRGQNQIGIMIPAADSSGYPARILGRVAEVLVVRLFPEHGPGTPSGPIVSPAWFARQLGARAGETGVNRIVAGIPADGVLWNNRGQARHITYAEALRLAEGASTPIARDPASGNLHATSARDGWELWVADHELIETLIAEGRRIGVTRFALFGLDGADPLLWQVLPQLVKR